MDEYWPIYKKEEFNKMIDRLNGLSPKYESWRWTRARKDHTDIFGNPVKSGEQYFTRKDGPAFGDVIKVSARSMEALVFALFNGNFALIELGDRVHKEREAEIAEAFRQWGDDRPSIAGLGDKDNESPKTED